jgi:1-acyl-sn-glycerol-3-phosphate acyltransferase
MHATHAESSRLLRWLHRDGAPEGGRDPGELDADHIEKTLRWGAHIFGPGKYFDIEAHGLDTIPEAPVMIVSNHSGGTTIPDVWGFAFAWYGHFGLGRPYHPLAHEVIMSTRATARFFGRLGVLRASRGIAREVLTRWKRDLMVMPGGDVDTWRPYQQRYQVQFGGRTGYARSAIQAGAPIVPVANAGAHETLYVLSDGRALARKLHLHSLTRANVFPIHLSLPWGLTIGPWPHLPIPTKLRYQIGKAIQPPPAPPPGEDPTQEAVLDLDAQVRAAVQSQLDTLRREAQ